MASGQLDLFPVVPPDIPNHPSTPAIQLDLFPSPDRFRGLHHDYRRRMNQHLIAIGANVGSKKAREKGILLLKENLSSEQLEQYESHGYFEVKGGKTGKTYRIHHGWQLNNFEMDGDGKQIMCWCFLPKGRLVSGDVMLVQKKRPGSL